MTIRANTLGKSALINRQINGAYDVVQYVADNLPFLMDIFHKIDTFHTILETYDVANHIADTSIHLTQEQISAINQVQNILTQLSADSTSIASILGSIGTLNQALENHTSNTEIHVTQEDKDKWNAYEEVTDEHIAEVVTPIVNTAVDRIEIPSLDEIEQNVANIQAELPDCLKREDVHDIALSGNYKDLEGVPTGDSYLSLSSSNWVKNKVVTEAINNLSGGLPQALTNAEIDAIMEGLNNDN